MQPFRLPSTEVFAACSGSISDLPPGGRVSSARPVRTERSSDGGVDSLSLSVEVRVKGAKDQVLRTQGRIRRQ